MAEIKPLVIKEKENLKTEVFATRAEMGAAAAKDIAACMRKLLAEKDEINMVFAAAPSQNETLAALAVEPDVDWTRVNAFHMDEYVGLEKSQPQSFGSYLYEHIFKLVPLKSISYICDHTVEEYSALLDAHHIDIVCLGIGENGHIAFNDPGVADFNDPKRIKVVDLDDVCRMQQVHDGCFPTFDDVPAQAKTLTITQMISSTYMFCSVPAATKRQAVLRTMTEEISENCPATIMRKHAHAIMYCDAAAGADLL